MINDDARDLGLSTSNLPSKGWIFDGFASGVDTFSLPTEVRPNALVQSLNAELYGKKSIRPRRGSVSLGTSLGAARIDGLYPYKEGANNYFLALSAGTLKKYDSTDGSWDAVTGGTFTSGLRTRAVKLRGNLYFGNGTDDFKRYNGTQVETFTAVAAPTNLAVAPQGTPATSEYSYSATAVTAKGQSLACTAVTITNGAATLDNTNYNRITFTRRTETEVIGYNLFGRTLTGMGRTMMIFIDQPASGATVTYDDKGTADPTIWIEPDGDSTDGPKCSIWEQLRGSLVGAGDPANPHTMYFSGTGDRYESFSPSHNGGWAMVRPGDNDAGISGLAPFEQNIIVPKHSSVHKFYFSQTTGDAILQEVLTYVGCGAPGSLVVMENDLAFIDSDRKLRILGYEPNYTAGIRTTSLSEGRVQSLYDEIDPSQMDNLEAIYHSGRYYLAATSQGQTRNDIVLVYDRRYLAFLGKWTGQDCHVRCWTVWDGVDGRKRLYAGSSDADGEVYEFGTGRTMYNNEAVETTLRFRNEDLGNSSQQKIWEWTDFRLYQILGTLNLKTIINGSQVVDVKGFSSNTSTGWGIKKWGVEKWGVQTGVAATASDLDQSYRKEIYDTANSLQHEITKTGANDDFTLVSMRGRALLLPEEVFDTARYI